MGFGKSNYPNPAARPQLQTGGKVNRKAIITKFASNNPTLQRALGVGAGAPKRGPSSFMKKVNQPLIKH